MLFPNLSPRAAIALLVFLGAVGSAIVLGVVEIAKNQTLRATPIIAKQ